MKDIDEKIIDDNGNIVFYNQNKKSPANKDETIKLVACGDTGAVRKLEKIVIEKGPLHILGEMKTVLDRADIRYINLEAVFSNQGAPLNRIPVFRVKPEAFTLIQEINPTVACLANNHMFDYGPEAFNETVWLLDQNNIAHFGAGNSIESALRPALVEFKGIKIGFIGFREKESKNFDHNGVITPEINQDIIIQNIRALKTRTDLVILSLHFGWEYQFYPSPRDVKLCRQFIDEGATIVLGHHPHYPQGVEVYSNGLICYSLGNYIWDQNFIGHTDASFAVEIDLNKNGITSAKVIPFKLTKDYKLTIQQKKQAFFELNRYSFILTQKRKLSEKWYFISRDKIIVFARSLKSIFRRCDGDWKRFLLALKSNNTYRFRYTALSLLIYFITLRFLYYEFAKRYRRVIEKGRTPD